MCQINPNIDQTLWLLHITSLKSDPKQQIAVGGMFAVSVAQ